MEILSSVLIVIGLVAFILGGIFLNAASQAGDQIIAKISFVVCGVAVSMCLIGFYLAYYFPADPILAATVGRVETFESVSITLACTLLLIAFILIGVGTDNKDYLFLTIGFVFVCAASAVYALYALTKSLPLP